jgi:hypothetical protein
MSQHQHATPVTLELPELLMLLWGFDDSIHIVARGISASVCADVLDQMHIPGFNKTGRTTPQP